MSVSANRQQARIWLETAHEDFQTAHVLRESGSHAAACFYSQQSAEKAVKALWYLIDQEPWGHSVTRLLDEYAQRDLLKQLDEWIACARSLDQFYIPTRYPDSLPGITPGQAYGSKDSERAFSCAEIILHGCDAVLSQI